MAIAPSPHRSVTVVPEATLAYGVQLPVQALSRLIAAPWEQDAGPQDLLECALAAERAGCFYVAICDHVAIPRDRADAMSTTWYNPVATLGWLAGQTDRVRVMSSVYVAPLRHPAETAKAFATLDALSNGRAMLGVGAGHVEAEFDALGVSFADRGRLLDEAIDEVVARWSDEYVHDLGQRPRPVQSPRPPIWVGGSSKPAMRRVGARGDGWIPQGTPRTEMADAVAFIRGVRDELRPGNPLDLGYITERIWLGDAADWELPKGTLAGTPEAIAESMSEIAALGVNHLQLRFAARTHEEWCDQLERFGADVAPHLASPSPDPARGD